MNVLPIRRAPLRVLHIGSFYPPHIVGGAEKVVAQLAEAQAARGMDVAAAYLSRHRELSFRQNAVTVFPQESRNLVWSEDVASKPRLTRSLNKLHQIVNGRTANDFAGAMLRFGADIVHTHSMVDLPPHIWERARQIGARVVHTLHDYDLLCSRATLFRDGQSCTDRHLACRVVGGWKGRFARNIDAVVAVSKPVLDEHHRYGLFAELPESRQSVIWNALPEATNLPVRRRRQGPLVFGFLGRVVPEKGIETLLRACRLLEGDGWRLEIAGRTGPAEAELRELAPARSVRFVGFVEPRGFLDSIDVLVVPSVWREPFGLTVIEAYARGVPVIGADSGAIGSLVGSVDPDWIVPPGDPDALAAMMRRVIARGRVALPDPACFAPLLEAVQPDRMVEAYSAVYRNVLTRRIAA